MELHELDLLLEESGQKEIGVPAARKSKYRLKRRDLKFFAESLSRLLTGGIPILRALEAIAQSSPSRLKKFLSAISESVRQGMSLKEALEKSGAVPAFFSQIVYAGEVSGSTPLVLEELARYLDKEEALKRRVQEALAYPLFILAMGFVTLTVLLQIVIPKLAALYQDFDTQLPWMTQAILSLSKGFLPFFLIAVFLLTLSVYFINKNQDRTVKVFSAIPFAGGFLKMFTLVQFSRLVSLLLESGIVILEALEITAGTFREPWKKQIHDLKRGLEEGKGFSHCLAAVTWIDDLSKMMVTSGEESGRMPQSFSQIARDTEIRLEAKIQMLVKLLEPSLILVIGLVVGFVVIGTVLPIFDMSGILK